jgi:hypothetical protein
VWPTSDPTLEGLQFGSFLIVVGGLLVWWWGGDAGLRLGATFREWRVVVVAGAALAAVTLTYVTVTGPNPCRGADPLFEIVLVPVGEELVFRSQLLGLVFGAVRVRTGSLAAPIALHAVVNGLNLLA